jgi:hypothetical protein
MDDDKRRWQAPLARPCCGALAAPHRAGESTGAKKCIEVVTGLRDSFLMERLPNTLKHERPSVRIIGVGEKSCQRVVAFSR